MFISIRRYIALFHKYASVFVLNNGEESGPIEDLLKKL